ncbi:MAG: hypothetical protein PHQ98_02475 [Candidatus ainarchaeum sp.]|nr:hypothetical protein [Candidatus ainarchaeum sp.]
MNLSTILNTEILKNSMLTKLNLLNSFLFKQTNIFSNGLGVGLIIASLFYAVLYSELIGKTDKPHEKAIQILWPLIAVQLALNIMKLSNEVLNLFSLVILTPILLKHYLKFDNLLILTITVKLIILIFILNITILSIGVLIIIALIILNLGYYEVNKKLNDKEKK